MQFDYHQHVVRLTSWCGDASGVARQPHQIDTDRGEVQKSKTGVTVNAKRSAFDNVLKYIFKTINWNLSRMLLLWKRYIIFFFDKLSKVVFRINSRPLYLIMPFPFDTRCSVNQCWLFWVRKGFSCRSKSIFLL